MAELTREHKRALALKEIFGVDPLTRDRFNHLHANIERMDDVAMALASGAEGIGLYRSEFLLAMGAGGGADDGGGRGGAASTGTSTRAGRGESIRLASIGSGAMNV